MTSGRDGPDHVAERAAHVQPGQDTGPRSEGAHGVTTELWLWTPTSSVDTINCIDPMDNVRIGTTLISMLI